MSNFGSKLAEILERNKMRASELSRASKITEALISRWINGQQIFVSTDDLATITSTLNKSSADQAALIRAHLLDEMGVAPGCQLIDISVRNSPGMNETTPNYRVSLPLRLQRAFDVLERESVTDADVRSVIVGLANTLRRGAVPEEEEQTNSTEEAAKKIVAVVDYHARNSRKAAK